MEKEKEVRGLSWSVQHVKVKVGSSQNSSQQQDCGNITKDGGNCLVKQALGRRSLKEFDVSCWTCGCFQRISLCMVHVSFENTGPKT